MSGAEIVDLCRKHTFFEWSAQGAVDPIPMARAKGVYFWTPEGKRYLDFNSQLMCVNIGHGDERVIRAIAEQAATLAYANPFMATEARGRLGARLADIAPGDIDVFFFTNGGAEANENAIKIARAYTGRHKILARYRSYHGGTHGAMALTGDPRRWASEPGMPGVVHVLDPYHGMARGWDSADEALANLEEIIQLEGAQTIAAFFLETVTGTNGILIPPDGYLQGVRELCTKHGILMVCDEVMAGFGRTGRVVRRQPLERRPRHHHDGEGADERLRSARRRRHAAADRRSLPRQGVPGRTDVQQPPARVRRGAGDAERLRRGRSHRQRAAARSRDDRAAEGSRRRAPIGRRASQHRALRDRRAGARTRRRRAARAVRRHLGRDEAARRSCSARTGSTPSRGGTRSSPTRRSASPRRSCAKASRSSTRR